MKFIIALIKKLFQKGWGFIAGFFTAKLTVKGVLLTFIVLQVAVVSVVTAGIVGYVVATVYGFTWSYNMLIELSTIVSSAGGGLLGCAFYGLECTGIKSAYENGINLLYGALVIRIGFIVKRFIVNSFSRLSSEIFKLANLIGQL